MLSTDFRTYARLLLALHALIQDGHGDGDDADHVREDMDFRWHAMSKPEQVLARTLSENLYAAVRDTVVATPPKANPHEAQLLRDIAEANRKHDGELVLERLGAVTHLLPPATVAYLRGRAWSDLAVADVAVAFFEAARRNDPRNGHYQFLALDALTESDPAKAQAQVREILSAPANHDAVLVAKAVQHRFVDTREMPRAEAERVCRDLLAVCIEIRPQLIAQADVPPSALALALVTEGMCHEHLNETEAAHRCYDEALARDPSNEAALTARGLLLYGVEDAAITDLRAACAKDTPLVWPYLLLAHRAVTQRRYDECERLCNAALMKGPSDKAAADLFEWLAISQLVLGRSRGIVQENFRRAVSLAPGNQRICQNFATFERMADQAATSTPWKYELEREISKAGREEFALPRAA